MAYQDFLREFAIAQRIPNVETLLTKYAKQYAFQIGSRTRAHDVIELLRMQLNLNPRGLNVLDLGCAYGSFAVEFAKLGAHVVGVDISDKWLKLAIANAKDEADCKFVKCDASARQLRTMVADDLPFDLVVANDVLEHIYDTVALLENLRAIMKKGGYLYYKIPNGFATRSVLSEGHKKVFGISLLPPDYWHFFVGAPFQIYYRREPYYESLFNSFEFRRVSNLTPVTDSSREQTKKHVRSDISKIKKMLTRDNIADVKQYKVLRDVLKYYFEEVDQDLQSMQWEPLFRKYRATFWTGMLQV